jgi:hypothetical protein
MLTFSGMPDAWVGVQVAGDQTELPRQHLNAAPYAMSAFSADSLSGVLPIANGGTGSNTQNFVDVSTKQAISGAKTFNDPATFNGLVTIGAGIAFPANKVMRTAATDGATFVNQIVAGTNVCGNAAYHPCTAWEVMVIDEISATPLFDQQGWVVGSFPNIDFHMRSLVNGQDSTVCPTGSHLTKFPSVFQNGNFATAGGLHCVADTTSLPAWCCRNRGQ